MYGGSIRAVSLESLFPKPKIPKELKSQGRLRVRLSGPEYLLDDKLFNDTFGFVIYWYKSCQTEPLCIAANKWDVGITCLFMSVVNDFCRPPCTVVIIIAPDREAGTCLLRPRPTVSTLFTLFTPSLSCRCSEVPRAHKRTFPNTGAFGVFS